MKPASQRALLAEVRSAEFKRAALKGRIKSLERRVQFIEDSLSSLSSDSVSLKRAEGKSDDG